MSVNPRERFDALEASRLSLLKRLGGVDPKLWVKAPRPGSWSLAEITEHLVLAEEEVLRQLRNRDPDFTRRQTLRDVLGRSVVGWIFRLGLPVRTPMHSMVPTGGRSLAELRHDWERARSELGAYVAALREEDRGKVVFRHPVAGRATMEQTLELIRAHFEDHVRQAAQIAGDEAMSQEYGSPDDDLRDGRPPTSSDGDISGTRVPPPLVFLATILVGVAIDRAVPLRIVPTAVAAWLGGALVLIGLVISGLSVREFRKAKTTIRPNRPASTLVATGPFRYSRNPMYIALSIVQAGLGVWLNSAWVLVLLVPTLVWIRHSVIAREERHLGAKFGETYLAYQARVRRWL